MSKNNISEKAMEIIKHAITDERYDTTDKAFEIRRQRGRSIDKITVYEKLPRNDEAELLKLAIPKGIDFSKNIAYNTLCAITDLVLQNAILNNVFAVLDKVKEICINNQDSKKIQTIETITDIYLKFLESYKSKITPKPKPITQSVTKTVEGDSTDIQRH